MVLAWFVLKHLVVVTLIASTALAAGLPWVRRLSMTGAERVAVAMAVGLAVAGHVALGLGLTGRLEPVGIIVLILFAHLAARRDLRDLFWAGQRWCRKARRGAWLAFPFGVLALSPLVFCALYPPTGFDETLYHLPYAQAFVRARGLPFLADLRFPIFPRFVETSFAVVLALAGDVATHGVSLVATLATALLVGTWASRATTRIGRSEPGGGGVANGIAAATLLGQPIGVYLAGTAYVEPALALFAAAAVYSADRWRWEADRAWLILAGLLSGTAAASKYTGLLILAGVSIQIVVGARDRVARNLLTYGGVVVATLAVSYGQLLYHTGNPLFPFFPALFGSTPWDASEFLLPSGIQHGAALLTLPWTVVFDRHAIGGLPPFSPLWSLGLALVLIAAWWNRDVRRWALWIIGLILFEPLRAHYLWTGMPILALACGVSCVEILGHVRAVAGHLRRTRATWLPLVFALCVLPGWLYGVYRLIRLGPLPADDGARTAFLATQRPLFSALNFLNDRCRDSCTVYGVHAEHMVYFAAGRFLGDWNGPASFARTLPEDGDAETFSRSLHRLGARYVLVPVGSRRETGLFGADAPGFRWIYGDAAADAYELSWPGAADLNEPGRLNVESIPAAPASVGR